MQWYRSAPTKLLNKEADLDSDTLVGTLHTSSYTPNLDTHDYVDDLTNEHANSGGYTTGGATLASKTLTQTAANSWGTQWAAATAYAVDWIVRPTSGNGFLYRVAVAGTSHASTQPTWPTTVGLTVVDQGVTWECVGRAVLTFDAADLVWSSSTITARYLVISDRTPGASNAQPLIGLEDFSTDKSSSSAAFTVTFSAQGILHVFS